MSYTVAWRWNDRDYYETFPTLIQAMMRKWRLDMEDKDASIHVKE